MHNNWLKQPWMKSVKPLVAASAHYTKRYARHLTRNWLQPGLAAPGSYPVTDGGTAYLQQARATLRQLVEDKQIPTVVRDALATDYQQVQWLLDKLDQDQIHIAVLGRVSVGKSALLNALLGETQFETSPLNGMTRTAQLANWQEYKTQGIYLIDTPGINEIQGEAREQLAHEVSARSDLVLFVVDGDFTQTEFEALTILAQQSRPIILVLNKADHYTQTQKKLLLDQLKLRTQGFIHPDYIVATTAHPTAQIIVELDEHGQEQEVYRTPPPDTAALKALLFKILEREGKLLAALNASLFAGQLSDQLAQRITAAKRLLADQLIRTHCLIKGVSVALNPVPVVDLFAAIGVDVIMVVNLGYLYGMPVTRAEAGRLIRTIGAQMVAIMGSIWAVHLVSSLLKTTSFGLSTLLTATAQGAVAYYGTYVVGQAAGRYFAQGKSWGEAGPKSLVQTILNSLDRDSILEQARQDIASRLMGDRADFKP